MATYTAVSLSNPLYDKISQKIRISYPNACVLYIDEVHNPRLEEAYEKRKSQMPHATERLLFHGTKSANITNIANTGFDTGFNKTSAYGIGTYFAVNAEYSKNYTDVDKAGVSYIFLCDVLVGNYKRFDGTVPITMDNSVNNTLNPTIYVTPYNDACYPRYLVAFHKNAK